jgi:hypothetical protein
MNEYGKYRHVFLMPLLKCEYHRAGLNEVHSHTTALILCHRRMDGLAEGLIWSSHKALFLVLDQERRNQTG